MPLRWMPRAWTWSSSEEATPEPTVWAPPYARELGWSTSSRSCLDPPTSGPTPTRGQLGRWSTGCRRLTRRAANASTPSTLQNSLAGTVGSALCAPTG